MEEIDSTHESARAVEARRRGLRVAAKLAATTIALAACAATASAGEAKPPRARTGTQDSAEHLADLVTVRQAGGGCGCAPCWGPPAPPAMPDDLDLDPCGGTHGLA